MKWQIRCILRIVRIYSDAPAEKYLVQHCANADIRHRFL